MKNKAFLKIILILSLCLLMTACLPGDGKNTKDNPAGFLWGLWHGIIMIVSLIVSIFKSNISIYITRSFTNIIFDIIQDTIIEIFSYKEVDTTTRERNFWDRQDMKVDKIIFSGHQTKRPSLTCHICIRICHIQRHKIFSIIRIRKHKSISRNSEKIWIYLACSHIKTKSFLRNSTQTYISKNSNFLKRI